MPHPLQIAPSLLSANFARLEDDVRICQQAGAEILHVDVMDGHFVPNITIGSLVVEALRPITTMTLDCHLMIENPDAYIPAFAKAGADWISVHVEASRHLHRSLALIREHGCRPGIVLNPSTPLEYAFAAAESSNNCEYILLMSVNPGFGGQKFISSFLKRAAILRHWLDSNGLAQVEIEVDGGLKADNTAEIVRAGANLLVSGSGIFSGDIAGNIAAIRKAAQNALRLRV